MKKIILFLSGLITFHVTNAQNLPNDSLLGFDLYKTASEGHQKNFEKEELKIYIQKAQREFIYQKYHKNPFETQTNQTGKYSTNTTLNSPCFNEDFEASSTGTLTTVSGWSPKQSSTYMSFCSSSLTSLSNNSTAISVSNTPITDPVIGIVGASPFGGSKVAKINTGGNVTARISNNFPVLSSNWLFNYAYMGVLSQQLHGCCDDAYLMFRFYDCLGNPISSLSHTVVMGTPSCIATSTANWAVSTVSIASWPVNYTPNWQIFSVNLSPYIGNCLTFEVTASGCYSGVHPGYAYFDAKCSAGNAIIVNNDTYLSPASSYTSCPAQTTLSALPGFSSYLWQGPASSGISGSTSSVITTSVSGNYTLTANLGTINATQILSLTIAPSINLNILGNMSICDGQSTTLQVSGNGVSSFTWNTNSNSQSITINPTSTTIYSVTATSTAGCLSSAFATVTVLPSPLPGIASVPPTICEGQSSTLTVIPLTAYSYTWSNGATGSSAIVSPSVSSNYTVTGTNSVGCTRSLSVSVNVLPLPQLSVTVGSPSVCPGQTVSIFVNGISGNTYNWSNGATCSTAVVSPSVSSNYTVTGTNSVGCTRTLSVSVNVLPSAQLSVAVSSPTICQGQTVSIFASGISGNTYSWSTGSNSSSISVSPASTSVYTVTATTTSNCSETNTALVTVYPLPQVQLIGSNSEICVGQSVNIGVLGNNIASLLWNTGMNTTSITVTPTLNTIYSVTVSSAEGCINEASVSIGVNPLPFVQIVASSASICAGESATLTAINSNVTNFAWSGNQTTSFIIVSPSVTTNYSVVVTDLKGCAANSNFQLEVYTCSDTLGNVGIHEFNIDKQKLMIVPNPSDGSFEIRGFKTEKGVLITELGQFISTFYLEAENSYTHKVINLAKGVYFVKGEYSTTKIIVR